MDTKSEYSSDLPSTGIWTPMSSSYTVQPQSERREHVHCEMCDNRKATLHKNIVRSAILVALVAMVCATIVAIDMIDAWSKKQSGW
jgi:hypothetical protein